MVTPAAIFYDPSGRRRRRFHGAVAAFVLLLVLAITVFVASILAVIPNAQLPFVVERPSMRAAPPFDNFIPHVDRSFRRAMHYADHLWSGRAATGNPPLAM